jgi:hypothetical protein
MFAKWDMLVAMMLAQISWTGFPSEQHANRGKGAIGTRAIQVAIFRESGRTALEQPRPSQEIVR